MRVLRRIHSPIVRRGLWGPAPALRLQAAAHSSEVEASRPLDGAAASATAPAAPRPLKRARIPRSLLKEDGKSLADFLREASSASSVGDSSSSSSSTSSSSSSSSSSSAASLVSEMSLPAADVRQLFASERPRYYLETYGCQMNESDSEIVSAVLASHGFERTEEMEDADVILVNTCAIRENAETRVWKRLALFRSLKRRTKAHHRPVVGVLGCMAERLKTQLLESDKMVDLVAGPDAYRDLPNLIAVVRGTNDLAVNVQLSQDETYADLAPVRAGAAGSPQAFVSIMRGCNNMCAFCVVPFTRGRERSRPVASILDEVRTLRDEGYREIVLLGQNVNSFHDKSSASEGRWAHASAGYEAVPGFQNMFRARDGDGPRFAELLDRVSLAVPEVRVRFTSPHPKDFPDVLLQLIAERANLGKSIHIPAQSGSSAVLARMRRGYTREAYLDLVDRMRTLIPGVALSTDMIAGFCGETEEDHAASVALMEHVRFEQAFLFAYSMRERTHAAYKLDDDVPEPVKLRRLQAIVDTFQAGVAARNREDHGTRHLVLVEGRSRRWREDARLLKGRTDTNKRVLFPEGAIAASFAAFAERHGARPRADHALRHSRASLALAHDFPALDPTLPVAPVRVGDWVVVDVVDSTAKALFGVPVAHSSIPEFAAIHTRT